MCRNTLTSIGAVASIVALLALAACGGGSGSPSGSASQSVHALDLPEFGIEATQRTPVIRFGSELRVGAMRPPGRGALASAATHGDAAVRYGRLRDGLGAAELTDYLSADTSFGGGILLRFPTAPVVRFVEGTTTGQIDEIVRAVQLINANLPRDFQLTVDPTPVSEAAVPPGIGTDPTMADDQILVEYDRREDWELAPEAEDEVGDETLGIASVRFYPKSGIWLPVRSPEALVDWGDERVERGP